jgi:uncharacterized integral membrane protein (TIGR00698 family)
LPAQQNVQFALEAQRAHTATPRTILLAPTWLYRIAGLAPGVGLTAAVAAVATALGGLAPVVGAPVIAIVFGIALSLLRKPSARLHPGIAFSSKSVLKASIVVLGSGLSLGQVLSTGSKSLPVLAGTLVSALAMAWLAGRLLGLRGDVLTMIGVGTAVCGASAIAATDAVIDADQADVSYAIATIFTFNVVAVLSYPTLGHLFGLSQHAFGLWAGTAINDLSSVLAASTIYGHAAATYGVIVKLTRTLAIIPISLGLAGFRAWRRGQHGEAVSGGQVELRRVLPLFVGVFMVAVVANTLGLVPAGWHHPLSDLATWMITAALAAIGLSTDLSHIRRTGPRPLGLGMVLWLTVGLTSLGLQALTGTL